MTIRKKGIASIFMASLLLSCGCERPVARMPEGKARPPLNDEDASREFVDGLVELGYLKFVDPADHDQVRDQLVQSVSYGVLLTRADDNTLAYPDKRLYVSDAENLAEGIAYAVKRLAPVLQREGVDLPSIADTRRGDKIGLAIGDRQYLIYDWPNREPIDLDTWGLGHKRLVEIVSELLADAGSEERLYGMGRSNDAHVILLTDELYQFINTATIELDSNWLPTPADHMKLAHEP